MTGFLQVQWKIAECNRCAAKKKKRKKNILSYRFKKYQTEINENSTKDLNDAKWGSWLNHTSAKTETICDTLLKQNTLK